MVQRTKRGIGEADAQAMKETLRTFHGEVRGWCARAPTGSALYVALDGMNAACLILEGQINATIDSSYRRPFGQNGIE